MPASAQVASRDGTYSGVAVPLRSSGGQCRQTLDVTNFRVTGNNVRYGQFRGTIAPDNGVQMVAGHQWIIGQFEGENFVGQYDNPGSGRFGAIGCAYLLNLQRTAP